MRDLSLVETLAKLGCWLVVHTSCRWFEKSHELNLFPNIALYERKSILSLVDLTRQYVFSVSCFRPFFFACPTTCSGTSLYRLPVPLA